MAYVLNANHTQFSGGANGGTSGNVDTTGGDLIVIEYNFYTGSSPATLSDNKSNFYTDLTAQSDGVARTIPSYVQNPAVGSGHNFSVAGTTSFSSLYMLGFSGSTPTPFDQQSGDNPTGTVGSITPSVDNCLVISGCVTQGTGHSMNGGFSVPEEGPNGTGTNFGGGIGYLIQTTAAVSAPTWSWTPVIDTTFAGRQASFKPATGGGDVLFAQSWM